VATIAGTPGVAIAAPALERRTYLAGSLDGAELPPPVTVLGIDPVADARLHDLVLVAGSPLSEPDEHSALITEHLAAQDGLTVGSPISMQAAGDPVSYRVIGVG